VATYSRHVPQCPRFSLIRPRPTGGLDTGLSPFPEEADREELFRAGPGRRGRRPPWSERCADDGARREWLRGPVGDDRPAWVGTNRPTGTRGTLRQRRQCGPARIRPPLRAELSERTRPSKGGSEIGTIHRVADKVTLVPRDQDLCGHQGGKDVHDGVVIGAGAPPHRKSISELGPSCPGREQPQRSRARRRISRRRPEHRHPTPGTHESNELIELGVPAEQRSVGFLRVEVREGQDLTPVFPYPPNNAGASGPRFTPNRHPPMFARGGSRHGRVGRAAPGATSSVK
jgi:hypothetical protein